MGRHKKPRCTFDNPDCENCPYDDCIATTKDVLRQMRFKDVEIKKARNLDIYDMFVNQGAPPEIIADKYGIHPDYVYDLVRKVKKEMKDGG